MARGIDIGTMFVVSAQEEGADVVFTKERGAYFTFVDEDAIDMLEETGASTVKIGDTIHAIGDDAIRYANLTAQFENFHRPMSKGVLNPAEEDAIAILRYIINGVGGKPSFSGEICAVTSPADPLDGSFDTTFHRTLLKSHIEKMGYTPIILNESLAIIYSENPVIKTDEGDIPFSGIGISFGAGMVNLVAAWRGKKLVEFSITKGGDWIDQKVSEVTNTPMSKVIKFKESKWGKLEKYNSKDQRLVSALDIYYDALIEEALTNFIDQFEKQDRSYDDPVEVIVAGGTSLAPNFIKKFKDVFGKLDIPFDLEGVRHAKDPLTAVANGALVAAKSYEKKTLKKSDSGKSGKDDDSKKVS